MMLATRIAKLRSQTGWSQAQLAKTLQVDLKTVRKWESGDSEPSAKNILRLCQVFSVSADYLLGKEDTPSIYIGSLCKEDQKRISAMVQVFINLSSSK